MLRDLKELRWRRKGPPLPASVLEAAKLKIDPEGQGRWRLPKAYRHFLSQMDGGRPGRGAFRIDGATFVIEGFYAFADAANMAERLRKGGKLPEGILPVAFAENDKPLVFLELEEEGKVFLKASPRTRFEDTAAPLSDDFAEFLDMLGDPDEVSGNGAAPAAAVNPWGIPEPVRPARKAKKPVAAPAAKKAPAKKTPATKKKAPAKKAPAAKKKAPAKKKSAAKKKAPAKKKTAAKKKAPAKKAPAKKAAKKKAAKKGPAKKAAKTKAGSRRR